MPRSKYERDWQNEPVLPVSLSVFERVVVKLAALEWARHKSGLPPYHVARPNELLAALAQPYQEWGGEQLYPTTTAKAACLFRGLIKNHPLFDGNKRVAVTCMSSFLFINGRYMTYSNTAILRYALRIARHKGNYPLEHIDGWVRRHSIWLPPRSLKASREMWVELAKGAGPNP